MFYLSRLPLTKSSSPQIRAGGSDLPLLACVRVVIKSKEVFHGEERVCEVRLVIFAVLPFMEGAGVRILLTSLYVIVRRYKKQFEQ
jgi:hypothetical protein